MAKKIENYKYGVEEAFRNCFYIVPDYQREYVWTEKEVKQLLDDVISEFVRDSKEEYFIGTILVSPTSDNDHFEVIDGQQRLTTLFLIICALRLLVKENSGSFSSLISSSCTNSDGDFDVKFKLEPRYGNSFELIKMITALDDADEDLWTTLESNGIKVFDSLRNLVNGFDEIVLYLRTEFKEVAELKRFWGYLSRKVVFIQIEADVNRALKIFETINERGVGLNPMDLLKNLMFTHVPKKEFLKLKTEWAKISETLGKNKEKPLRFLRYYLMANYKIDNKRKDSIVREDEIYEWITHKDNIELCGYNKDPFLFVRKLIEGVGSYISFSKGRGKDGDDNVYLDNIKKLCGAGFSLHYVLLLAARNIKPDLFLYLTKQLESFLFYYIITKTSTKDLERNFSKWADELREIAKLSLHEEQRNGLNAFVQTHFQQGVLGKKAEFVDYFKRYNYYSLQQYRTRYILAKLSQYVDMQYQGTTTLTKLDDYTKNQIEHILPNTPTAEHKADFESSNDGCSYEEYKIKLGNLTLLEQPINGSIGRKYFEDKVKEYSKSRVYLTKSISAKTTKIGDTSIDRINERLIAFDQWSASEIDRRQEMLLNIAVEIWKITEDIPSK